MKLKKLTLAIVATSLTSGGAWATNGMNLEGYGAKATAMGGAGMAYDTGNSAVMNNPATLALMKEDTARLGIGIRNLGPDVSASVPAMGIPSADSDGTSYWMPSASYMRRDGNFTYGAAVLAQGGMGTEWGKNTQMFQGGLSMTGAATALSGQEIRSEVSVGRVMFPLAYNVNNRLTIGGSIDAVWAGMDMLMDLDGAHFAQLMGGNGGSVSGSMATKLNGMIAGGIVTDVNWARFDFGDNSDYTGEAKGWGLGVKIGFTYAVNDRLRIGASYHTKTGISDMESGTETMSMNVVMGGVAQQIDIKGTYKVVDFQWPATWALGAAFKATDKLLLVGDVKVLQWADVMDNFHVTFEANTSQTGAAVGFAGDDIDVSMTQGWDNQTVVSLGAQYQMTPDLALRGGVNLSDNPVPNQFLNPLFPATIENNFSAGFGYRINPSNKIGFSATYAPKVTETNADGIKISHSQFNWQVNYVYLFN